MAVVAAQDQGLYELVSAPAPTDIEGVIQRMQQIDASLPNDDGLKWFNGLYLSVTREIDLQPVERWKDSAWLLDLDVVFAGFYFRALAGFLRADSSVPRSWVAILEARHRSEIDRIQFALAGMNAHINHDLALALNAVADRAGVVPGIDSPQHADYLAVNLLLNALIPATLQVLATDTLGVLAQDTGKIGRLLAFWDICKARDLAWDFANHLRQLPATVRPIALGTQDQLTGALGRAILAFC